MFVISINYKTASTDFRQSFVFGEDKTKLFFSSVKEAGISECVYVNTCNRCEVYGVGKATKLLPIWAELAGISVEELKQNVLGICFSGL